MERQRKKNQYREQMKAKRKSTRKQRKGSEKKEGERKEKKQKIAKCSNAKKPSLTFNLNCYYSITRESKNNRGKFDKSYFNHFRYVPLVAMNLTHSKLPAFSASLKLSHNPSIHKREVQKPRPIPLFLHVPELNPLQSQKIYAVVSEDSIGIPLGLQTRTWWVQKDGDMILASNLSSEWIPSGELPGLGKGEQPDLEIRSMMPIRMHYSYLQDERGLVQIYDRGEFVGRIHYLESKREASGGLQLLFRDVSGDAICHVPRRLKDDLLLVDKDNLQDPNLSHVYEPYQPPRKKIVAEYRIGTFSLEGHGNFGFGIDLVELSAQKLSFSLFGGKKDQQYDVRYVFGIDDLYVVYSLIPDEEASFVRYDASYRYDPQFWDYHSRFKDGVDQARMLFGFVDSEVFVEPNGNFSVYVPEGEGQLARRRLLQVAQSLINTILEINQYKDVQVWKDCAERLSTYLIDGNRELEKYRIKLHTSEADKIQDQSTGVPQMGLQEERHTIPQPVDDPRAYLVDIPPDEFEHILDTVTSIVPPSSPSSSVV